MEFTHGNVQVVGHTRDAVHAVDNRAGNLLQQSPGELERLGAHKVARRHGTEAIMLVVFRLVGSEEGRDVHDDVAVDASIAHDTDGWMC